MVVKLKVLFKEAETKTKGLKDADELEMWMNPPGFECDSQLVTELSYPRKLNHLPAWQRCNCLSSTVPKAMSVFNTCLNKSLQRRKQY
ncbi:hypothetical protein CEXT_60031 [Caerostris extrusa]|uniref:Uncharacterized protein n=1 Tax=Caerostris extrusa TaxID=172846 RepID=A0AAV4XWH2_CAEEX|nr:hypothetical protein CEXT_60031 [Caerostris extrusa]